MYKHISELLPTKEQMDLIEQALKLEQWTNEDEQKAYYKIITQLTPTSRAILAGLIATHQNETIYKD